MKICSECHAVHDGRKWNPACPLPSSNQSKAEFTMCTGCKRMRDKVVLGRVHLEGEAVATRSEEILRMIRREEQIEQARNHCSRIFDIDSRGSKMTVRTVNSLLAIHIAKQLRKTFKGKIQIYKNTPGRRPRNKQSEGTVTVKWTQHP
jgi:hypothetical protein